jgi:hypothetical protein
MLLPFVFVFIIAFVILALFIIIRKSKGKE